MCIFSFYNDTILLSLNVVPVVVNEGLADKRTNILHTAKKNFFIISVLIEPSFYSQVWIIVWN